MTEYRRYQGKSYMVWNGGGCATGYEYPMLEKNRIEGIVPMRIANTDEQMQIWYDISGKQALEDWIRIKKADSIFLRKFIAALAEAVMQAGEYLLCEDGISLLPEQVFIDPEEKEIAFCYMPFHKTPFPESLQGFMEYYLSHMEHTDRDGVQKCYAVYEKCQQEQVDLEGLLEILYRDESLKESMPCKSTQPEQGNCRTVEKEPNIPKMSFKPRKKKHFCIFDKKGFFGRKKKAVSRAYAYEAKEYPAESANPTVFLGSETDQMLGELRYEGEGTGTNLPVTADVYLIGSRSGEVDGIIRDETVSRIHARITREGDGFYLEDMNSTNGTYRNGELLNYKERVKLEKNDRIAFAQVNYRFV